MHELTASLRSHGLMVGTPVLDGEIHRVDCQDSRRGKRVGWYVGRMVNDKAFCSFGRWDADTSERWSSHDQRDYSHADLEALQFIRLRQEQDRQEKQSEAAERAMMIMEHSRPVKSHPYLTAKGIRPNGARIDDSGRLIVPIYDATGALVNVQRIDAAGNKRFLFGGRVKGCAGVVQGSQSTVCVCEGWATACSIYEATGHQVIVAFNVGNLPAIVEAVRVKYPQARLLVCADNDHERKGGNIGLDTARKAAKAHGGELRCPPVITGRKSTDFNDLHQSMGLAAVRETINIPEGVITAAEDIPVQSITLQIPPRVIADAGPLLGIGLEACQTGDSPGILQYSFPVVLSVLARAIAGKIRLGQVWPSIYSIKVGGTSTGKTHSDKLMRSAVRDAGLTDFYGPTNFASGPGLVRAMDPNNGGQPCCLFNIDEASYLFKRYDKPDPLSAGKIQALLELQTAAGQEIKKTYGDSKNIVHIQEPCLILTGNATPGIFSDIRVEDFESGLMQRFDFWAYDGPIPYRRYSGTDSGALAEFIHGVSSIVHSTHGEGLQRTLGCCIDVGATPETRERLRSYSRTITDAANVAAAQGEGVVGIISRQYDAAIKFGLIRMAASRPVETLAHPMDVADLEWGIAVAEMLAQWKIHVLAARVCQGAFHRDCEVFKEAIRQVIASGRRPTGGHLATRKRRLKELKPREFDDIVRALQARKEIVVDESGRSTAYYLTAAEEGVQ